jgi:hypothetical protein
VDSTSTSSSPDCDKFFQIAYMQAYCKEHNLEFLMTGIHFSTHSLRRGGATLLALAGHPNHYIRGMMRSKSDSFMRYITFAFGAMLQSQKSLLDSTIFTMADLLKTSPSIWN